MNLYVLNQYSGTASAYGIGTYIRELTYNLRQSLNICIIYLYSDKPQMTIEEIEGVKHWHIPATMVINSHLDPAKQSELYFQNVVYLLRLYIKDTSKLIFHFNYNKSTRLAKELKMAFDCKIVSVIHYNDWGLYLHGNLNYLHEIIRKPKEKRTTFEQIVFAGFLDEQVLMNTVDRIICLSEYMYTIVKEDYHIDPDKISIVHNGLKKVNVKSRKTLLRSKWQFSANEKLILFAGRIDGIKGLCFLGRAFREVLKQEPGCRLVIAGSGDYDVCMKETKDICAKITYTGFLEQSELHELYCLADIGVVPSLHEPFGYVAVEMMMHQLPVIATATSGLNELIEHGVHGLKVPVIESADSLEIDYNILAQRILQLIRNPLEARRIGKNGKKKYEQSYTVDLMCVKMLSIYNSFF